MLTMATSSILLNISEMFLPYCSVQMNTHATVLWHAVPFCSSSSLHANYKMPFSLTWLSLKVLNFSMN